MSKILVLDDDFSNAEAIQMVLENEGFNVERIIHSKLLLGAVARFCPDLIILDILLDGNDGRCLCNMLKRDTPTAPIPVLLITAMLESQVERIPCQADAVMFKPFDYMVLVQMVRVLLSKGSKQRQYSSSKPFLKKSVVNI